MSNSLEKLSTMHANIIGDSPTEDQKALYSVFPQSRGYSDSDLNAGRFEACALIALSEAANSDKVLIFAPVAHEKWVIDCHNDLADRIFTRCRSLGGDKASRVGLARAYKMLYQRVFITGKLLQMVDPPSHWVSFGFQASDPLPGWMSGRLLDS